MSQYLSKLGLGTAQWGMQYGISNTQGKASAEEVDSILDVARTSGVSLLDTASLYGTAEQTLGHSDLSSFRLVTKTPKFGKDSICNADADNLLQTFYVSLQKLGLTSAYGLLLHNAEDIFVPHGSKLIGALEQLKSQGLVSKIGVSVYNHDQINKALNLFRPDIIQLPINVLDQRLIQDGTIAHLSSLGIEVHARSVFLQGLLLMSSKDRPKYFQAWSLLLSKWEKFCADQFISPLHAALDFVCGLKDVSYVLVGVQNQYQLKEILKKTTKLNVSDFEQFASDDLELLDPSLWSLS